LGIDIKLAQDNCIEVLVANIMVLDLDFRLYHALKCDLFHEWYFLGSKIIFLFIFK